MRYLVSILIALVVLSSVCMADGITLWGSIETEIDSEASLMGRLGYRSGNLEPFVSGTWRPDYPWSLSLGSLMYGPDLADPESSVPVIPQLLSIYLSDEAVVKPYTDFQATWTLINTNAGYYGLIAGALVKDKPDSHLMTYFEYAKNRYDGEFEGITDEDKFSLGLKYEF